jgi:hypothetical protein
MSLQSTLDSITSSISQGFEVFVQNKVQAEVAPKTAQQVPTPQPIPVKASVESFVRDNTTVMLIAGAALAVYFLKK